MIVGIVHMAPSGLVAVTAPDGARRTVGIWQGYCDPILAVASGSEPPAVLITTGDLPAKAIEQLCDSGASVETHDRVSRVDVQDLAEDYERVCVFGARACANVGPLAEVLVVVQEHGPRHSVARRDSLEFVAFVLRGEACLLYTSDAADE